MIKLIKKLFSRKTVVKDDYKKFEEYLKEQGVNLYE